MVHRLLLSLCLVLVPGVAAAQSLQSLPPFELERLQFEPSGLGSLVVGTGRTLEPGVVRVSLEAQVEHQPLNFMRTWDPVVTAVGLVQNRFTGHVTAAVGVLPWLQLGAQLPYIIAQEGDVFRGIAPPVGRGLGSPWVSVRAAPLQVKNGAPLNFGVELAAGVPVGRTELLARDRFAVSPRVQASIQGEGFQVGGEVGALLRPRYDLSPLTNRERDVVGSELRVGATVTSRGKNKTSTRPELSMLLNLPLQGGRPSGEVLVGVRKHALEGLDLYFLGGPGLGTAVDIPIIRFLVGASFATGEVD